MPDAKHALGASLLSPSPLPPPPPPAKARHRIPPHQSRRRLRLTQVWDRSSQPASNGASTHPHTHLSPGLFHAISLKSADASPCCAAAAAVAFLPCPAPIRCVSRLGSAKNVTTQPCCIDGSDGHFHFHFHSGVPTSTSVPALVVSLSHPLLHIHRLFQPSILESV